MFAFSIEEVDTFFAAAKDDHGVDDFALFENSNGKERVLSGIVNNDNR